MPVEGSTKEAWHAISPNLPFSTVNPSGSYTTHAMVLVADGLKRKKGNLISSPNPRTRTRYPGIWIAWNVDRTHLVHREEHFFFFIIIIIIVVIIFFFSFFLSFSFFFLFVLKRFETTRARYFQNETFRRRRISSYASTYFVCVMWVSMYVYYYYFIGGRPVSLSGILTFSSYFFTFFFILFRLVYFHFPSLYVTVYRHA